LERGSKKKPFSRAELRIAEIGKLVRHRHGGAIPETDEPGNGYVFAVAVTIHAMHSDEADRRDLLLMWLARLAQ